MTDASFVYWKAPFKGPGTPLPSRHAVPFVPRVAHLTTVHHPFDPRIFWKECGTLREAGFAVHLVAQHTRSERRRGISIEALPPIEGRYRRVWLQPEVYRKARALGAEFYHIHDPELIPLAFLLKRTTGARVVYDMHEDYGRWKGPVEGRLLRALERWCFSWVDHVIISDEAYRHIADSAKAPVTLIANYFKPPDGVPAPETSRPSLKALRLVYGGVLSEERGLFNLLDLAHRIKREGKGWKVHLSGVCYREGVRRRAEEYIRAKGLEGTVERTGWKAYVPWPELLAGYENAHVGLALWEPHADLVQKIPTKFYEYLHYGLPILCSDFPLWRRFVEAHECGAVVPPKDARAALRVLKAWSENPAQYRRLAQNAREAAEAYRWAEMGERLVALYRRLLR